jgi:phospholipase C
VHTGVTIPNITQWRRQTFGDLTSTFGFPEFPPAVRQLPPTKPALHEAVTNVNTLALPAFPGASQTPPKQQVGPLPRPRGGRGESTES